MTKRLQTRKCIVCTGPTSLDCLQKFAMHALDVCMYTLAVVLGKHKKMILLGHLKYGFLEKSFNNECTFVS